MKIRGKINAGAPAFDLFIEKGRIDRVLPADFTREADFGDGNLHLAPGLIDIQINGYGGIDFNDPGTLDEQIAEATRGLHRRGVTTFYPTIITGSHRHMAQCLGNLVRAMDRHPHVARAIGGIHLEGPFISAEDGPRGAHPARDVRPPDWDEFQRLQDNARGLIRIVTLSPEWSDSLKFIERACQAGLVVGIGHTAASPERIVEAVRSGARLSTHLGNGSHAKIDRHPNYIWQQLAEDELAASLIVDGHHLPPSVVKCFLRCKTVSRTILISDAIAAAGMPSGRYRLGSVEVDVTPERRVCLPGTPYLAGSALEMDTAVSNLVRFSDASLAEALQTATLNPANLLGESGRIGSIAPGFDADLIAFRWDDAKIEIEIMMTMCRGEIVNSVNMEG